MADDAVDSLLNTWRAREIAGKKYAGTGGLLADVVVHGEATVGGTEAALPSATARRFRLKALGTNLGSIYIGGVGVSAATGWELAAGDVLAFSPEVSNLNVIHAIAANAGDKLRYWGEV